MGGRIRRRWSSATRSPTSPRCVGRSATGAGWGPAGWKWAHERTHQWTHPPFWQTQHAPPEGGNLKRGAEFWTVGPGRVELPTSRLSGVRSNHLSYEPSTAAKDNYRSSLVTISRPSPSPARI